MKTFRIAAVCSAASCTLLFASSASAAFAQYPQTGCANDIATDGNYLFVIGCNTLSDGDHGVYASQFSSRGAYMALPGGGQFISAGGGTYGSSFAGTSLSIVNNAEDAYFYSPAISNFALYPNPVATPVWRIANQYQRNANDSGYASLTNSNGNGPLGASAEWALIGSRTPTGYSIAYRMNPVGGTATSWTTVPGEAVEISVGQTDIPWVVNANGDVFKWDGYTGYFDQVQQWTGDAYSIAVDSTPTEDSAWVVDHSGRVWHYTSGTNVFTQVSAPANAGRIAAGYIYPNLQELVFLTVGQGTGNIYFQVN